MKRITKIAYFMSNRLGDFLLSMIVVKNLVRNGYEVTVYNGFSTVLTNLFPYVELKDYGSDAFADKTFDIVMATFAENIPADIVLQSYQVYICFDSKAFHGEFTMVQAMTDFCIKELNLKEVTQSNGIVVPGSNQYRKYINRVVIQPTSRDSYKNWHASKYMKLYRRLRKKQFQPVFVVSPSEYKSWAYLKEQGYQLEMFYSIDDWTNYLYESGYFIGNDSGGGHLASNIGIPTFIIGARKKLLRRWRPGWCDSKVIIPRRYLPLPTKIKHRVWQYMLSVWRVEREFLKYTQTNRRG